MRLIIFLAILLSFSSCSIFNGASGPKYATQVADSLIVDSDKDGIPDFKDEELDSDGDGIYDYEDMCPYLPGFPENAGCPDINVEVAQSQIVLDLPSHFIKSMDEIENQEIREILIEMNYTPIMVNERILEDMLNHGRISEKDFVKYKQEILSGKTPSIKNSHSGNISEKLSTDKLSVVDNAKADDNSSDGVIAYSVPSEMMVGKRYPIKVRISKEKTKEAKTTLVVGERNISINDVELDSKVTIENIRVEKTMTAQLMSENSSFEITSLSTETQNIEDKGYTEWSWVVVPLKSGHSYLKMIVKVKIRTGGQVSYKDIVVFDKNIEVKTNISAGFQSWLSEYWQWLLTTIFIPLIIFFYKNRKKKKSEE